MEGKKKLRTNREDKGKEMEFFFQYVDLNLKIL